MSYDIWLTAGACRDERPGNYTYNVDAMFALALGEPDAGVRGGVDVVLRRVEPALGRFRDKRAGDCVSSLDAAVAAMRANPTAYTKLNPASGWGNYEGALGYLEAFRDACRDSPDAIVEMWL